MSRRRPGCHAATGTEFEADDGRGPVGHDHLDGERRDFPVSAGVHLLDGVDEGIAATEPGFDHDREAILVDVRAAGVLPHRPAEDEREAFDPAQPPRLDPCQC